MDFQKLSQGLEQMNQSEQTMREAATLIEQSGFGAYFDQSGPSFDEAIRKQFEACRAILLRKSAICHVAIARVKSAFCYWGTFLVSPHIPRGIYREPGGEVIYSLIADAENRVIIGRGKDLDASIHIDGSEICFEEHLIRAFVAEDDAYKWCKSICKLDTRLSPLEDTNRSTKLTYTWL